MNLKRYFQGFKIEIIQIENLKKINTGGNKLHISRWFLLGFSGFFSRLIFVAADNYPFRNHLENMQVTVVQHIK